MIAGVTLVPAQDGANGVVLRHPSRCWSKVPGTILIFLADHVLADRNGLGVPEGRRRRSGVESRFPPLGSTCEIELRGACACVDRIGDMIEPGIVPPCCQASQFEIAVNDQLSSGERGNQGGGERDYDGGIVLVVACEVDRCLVESKVAPWSKSHFDGFARSGCDLQRESSIG